MRRPDIKGDAANAWQTPLPDKKFALGTTLDLWMVNGKGFHPFWSWWAVSTIDLGDFPGVRPAFKKYAAAEVELAVYALSSKSGTPPVNGEGPFDALEPANLVVHWHGITKAQSCLVVRFLVEAICAGSATPDPDSRRKNTEAMNKLVNDYYIGRYGGPVRMHPLEIDPFRECFTGEVDYDTHPWAKV